ncbi:MAG: DUF6909 family protein, partial [bacterium]
SRGSYKPFGVSGQALRDALLTLSPEIYGSMKDEERVEMDGLLYVIDRLPKGIEECRYIRMISKEGLGDSNFPVIIPPKRRRNCYRIDEEQMFIELTRGRSDIYDILTHLTFLYIESAKILRHSLDPKGKIRREWQKLEEIVQKEANGEEFNQEIAYTYLSNILGRTFEETAIACKKFTKANNNSLFHITYWLGRVAIEEFLEKKDREISFSAMLRDRIGHHIYGEGWANEIKLYLKEHDLLSRPVHIISANMHSVMNSLYGRAATKSSVEDPSVYALAERLSDPANASLREKVITFAARNGMKQLDDFQVTNISAQIIRTELLDFDCLPVELHPDKKGLLEAKPVLIVIDYPFGEQGFELMDELLKPLDEQQEQALDVRSISIMGKAGILAGKKGDIMIPNAHVFEGTADNYPFENDLKREDFEGHGLSVYDNGPMITVLGTSLQNQDVLLYFLRSSWRAIGLEMEGAHLQKAIQSAARIRSSISENVVLRYAYYASDNPLLTGHTLASGSLGKEGIRPTYLITLNILDKIFAMHKHKEADNEKQPTEFVSK